MINNIKNPLTQWDGRWSNTIVVTNTIGRIGCTITALSMLTGNSTYFDDPNAVNTICDFTDVYHTSGPNLIIWVSIAKLQGVNGYKRIWDNSHTDEIKKAIDDGHGVLIECENKAHWVACMRYGAGWDCVDPRTGQARILEVGECTGYCIVYLKKPTVILGPSAIDATIARIQGLNYADANDKAILVEAYQRNDGETVSKYLPKVERQQALGIIDSQTPKVATIYDSTHEVASPLDGLANSSDTVIGEDKTKTLPYWQRSIYDSLRTGSYSVGAFILANGGQEVLQELVNNDITQDSLMKAGLGIAIVFAGYVQERMKQERKRREKLA